MRMITEYESLPLDLLRERIVKAKKTLGERVLILGHNYQRDEVIEHADLRGDSLLLSQLAAKHSDRSYIVFCGVHFMAETADILSQSNQTVILPDMAAGCSMADMASLDQVEDAWKILGRVIDVESQVTPVVYVNSAADLKAFCGAHGGITCTSSNAQKVMEWSWNQREKILFFPDEHLGRNIANRMGIPKDRIIVWDPYALNGGVSPQAMRHATLILWKGFCSVHQMFQPVHVDNFRKQYPQGTVIVHPECHEDVVNKADLVGSTEFIIRTVTNAPAGSVWSVGTELNLVNRLKNELTDKKVFFLSSTICQCATMYRIDAPHLCWALENLVEGCIVNPISVPSDDKTWAKIALTRMMVVS